MTDTHILIVGLGNPGPEYALNRHNVGFMAIDAIADEYGIGPFRRKFKGQMVEGKINAQRVVLLKPETFMNLSGQSVAELAAYYKIPTARMIVLHDELDLLPGKLRVKMGGGAAGHNGLKSLDQYLPDNNYKRVRLGIGHPGDRDLVSPYVLNDVPKAERDALSDQLRAVAEHIALLFDNQDELFMTKVAGEEKKIKEKSL